MPPRLTTCRYPLPLLLHALLDRDSSTALRSSLLLILRHAHVDAKLQPYVAFELDSSTSTLFSQPKIATHTRARSLDRPINLLPPSQPNPLLTRSHSTHAGTPTTGRRWPITR